MILSMTGYGKAVGKYKNRQIVAEIRSLNSKQLDLSTKICNNYRSREIEIRNEIAKRVERGKVDFSLYIDSANSEVAPRINQQVVADYYAQIKQISDNLNIALPENWFEVLLRLPDATKADTDEMEEEEWEVIKNTIHAAIDQFIEFRQKEGASLDRVFRSNIENISALLSQIDPYEKERVEKIKQHLRDNLNSLGVDYDKNRFEQELIFYIEKLDVNEEKNRLRQHLHYFLQTMDDAASGKKLGFISQEIGREINTLGSKSNHSEMQKIVVKMKDELEQIKEQVLNVL
ncbi:MAG: YicC family protein [Bacteroidales bacterium]|nr:YicC family protein [Bacteroidales bacterium]